MAYDSILNSALSSQGSQISFGTDVTPGQHNIIRKSGNSVQMVVTLTYKWGAMDAGRELYVGTVPSGYRPSSERFSHGITKNKVTFGYSVYSDGAVRFWSNENLQSGDEICLNTTWVV